MSKLIAFEGIDRSGKTTQVKKLYDHFTALKLKFYITREPCDYDVRFELKNGCLTPEQQLKLILKDRIKHNPTIKYLLEDSDLVLCDRYTDSTLAYQGYGHGLNLDNLRKLNHEATGGIDPDMVILFDCPVEVAVRRDLDKPLDKIERDLLFLDRVRFGYLELAARQNNWIVIDTKRTTTRITQQISGILMGIIPVPVSG